MCSYFFVGAPKFFGVFSGSLSLSLTRYILSLLFVTIYLGFAQNTRYNKTQEKNRQELKCCQGVLEFRIITTFLINHQPFCQQSTFLTQRQVKSALSTIITSNRNILQLELQGIVCQEYLLLTYYSIFVNPTMRSTRAQTIHFKRPFDLVHNIGNEDKIQSIKK